MNFTAQDARKINEDYRQKVLAEILETIKTELHALPDATSVVFGTERPLSAKTQKELLIAEFELQSLNRQPTNDYSYFYVISW